jgi:hypothetical protein
LEAKVDALKEVQAETKKELNAMLSSILDKAFKWALLCLIEKDFMKNFKYKKLWLMLKLALS